MTPTDPLRGAQVRFGPEIFRIQATGGVSRYIIQLHRGLLDAGVDSEIEAGWHTSAMLDGVPRVNGRHGTVVARVPAGNVLTRFADERVAARSVRRLGPGDVWHPSYFPNHPPERGSDRPHLAVTVYDMIHERFPGSVSPRDHSAARKAAVCSVADVIFCISHDTARDLQDRLGVDPERIVVTHLGVAPVAPADRPSPFGDQPYVVFLGDRRPVYKNWPALLDALRDGPGSLSLLCVGAPAAAADLDAVHARGLGARVRFEGGTDREVAGRLRDALGLVYPSLYEGFGLPPLEALAQGCPVVASAVGAISEVVGQIAIMVEPTVEGIGGGLAQLAADGPAVQRQRSDGPAHAARFPWSSTADRTIAAYRRLLS